MSGARRIRRGGPGVVALALLLVALPMAAAELRQIESVGVAPIRADGGSRPPRDEALRAAVARGVEGVAEAILPAGWKERLPDDIDLRAGPSDLEPRLAIALGDDPFEYATRFRILEDRGVRDAVFHSEPDVDDEYVVVVEVFVDAGRLRERFQAAGWLASGSDRNGAPVRIVLQDLTSFGAYEAVRRALIDGLGMESATPVELSRGRAVLAAVGPYDAAGLQQALLRNTEAGLRIVPLSVDGDTLTLLVDYTAPPASRAPDSGDGSADETAGEPLVP